MSSLGELAASWEPSRDAALAALLGVSVVGYVLYHFGAKALQEAAPGQRGSVLRGRFLGAGLLGVSALGAPVLSPELLSLWALPRAAAWGVIGVGLCVLLPILWLAAGGAAHRAHYPQIRAERWTRGLVGQEALSWAAYLVAYEWTFRGLLVCALAGLVGLWPALLLGTALYVLAHLEKGLGECLACVPMGLLFGVLTLWSQSLWPAILLHLGLALAGNLFAVARDPGRRFDWGGAAEPQAAA